MKMHRRDFLTLLGGAAAWPLAARAQQPERVRRIGALMGNAENDPETQRDVAAFVQALEKLGWREGGNLRIEWRFAEFDAARARTLATELVALKPEAIFGTNTLGVSALQAATRTVPIVFALVNDPVGGGLVSSLAHPGANMTGFSDNDPLALGKLPGWIKEIAPSLTRVSILGSNAPDSVRTKAVMAAVLSVGLTPVISVVRNAREIEDAIAALARQPNSGLIVPGDPVTVPNRKSIIALAADRKLPAIYGYRYYVTDGGLMSYGTNWSDQCRNAAGYVDRILKGAKPNELPVQQPIKYELVVNRRTVRALGLEVPPTLLVAADEIIE
jgi:putative ABC transport system substrate-binding protein